MEARLVQRSKEIRQDGVYLGHLEWVVWSFLQEKRVKLCLGNELMDMYDWVCGYLGHPYMEAPERQVYIACVKIDGDSGQWLAVNGHAENSNHYVLAKARRLTPLGGLPEPLWTPPGGCAKEAARKAGCMLLATVAQGDCAPDCMAHYMGLSRDQKSWRAIRHALADFLQHHSQSPLWQDIATLCGEAEAEDPPLPPPAGSLGSSSSGFVGKASQLVQLPAPPDGASLAVAPGADSLVPRDTSPSPDLVDAGFP